MADATVDPNLYALSIALSLDSKEAFKQFDDFSTKVLEFEKQVEDAAASALDAFTDLFKVVSTNVEDITASLKMVDTSVGSIKAGFTTISTSLVEISGNQQKHLKDIKEINELTDEYVTMHSDLTDILKEQPKHLLKFVEFTNNITDAVNTKNLAHDRQTAAVIESTEAIRDMTKDIDKAKASVSKTTKLWRLVKTAILSASRALLDVDKMTEAFVTTNYRAYGSQQQLAQGVRNLTLEYGIFGEAAFGAMKHLMDLKTPQRELVKYSEIVAKANRFTGVAIEPLAKYVTQMRALGRSAIDTEKQLRWTSEAMRSLGLTTQDVSRLTETAGLSAQELQIAMGGANNAVETYSKVEASLMGMSKQMGMSTAVGSELAKSFADGGIAATNAAGLIGEAGVTSENFARIVAALGNEIKATGNDTASLAAEVRAGTMTSYDAQIRQQSYAESMGLSSVKALNLAEKVAEVARQQGIVIKTTADLERVMKIANNAQDPWTESMETFTAQLKVLTDWLGAAWRSVMQYAADSLIPILKGINAFLTYVGSAVVAVQKWVAEWRAAHPEWEFVAKGLQWVGGAILAIGLAIVAVTPLLGGFAILFSGSVATAITAVSTAIATGLTTIGAAVQGVMVPLLALSASLLLISGSVYIFSQSLAVLAALPWYVVALGLVGVAVEIWAMNSALVALGSVSPAAMAGALVLLTVAGAFSLVAVSIAAVIASVALLTYSFVALAQSISVELIKNLPAFGYALFQFSIWGAAAAVGLALAAAGMQVLGIGLATVVVGMMGFGVAIGVVGYGLSFMSEQLDSLEGLFGILGSGNVLLATINIALFGAAVTGLGWAVYPITPALLVLTGAMAAIAIASIAVSNSISTLGTSFATIETDKIKNINTLIVQLGTVGIKSSNNIAALSKSLSGIGASLSGAGEGLSKFTADTIALLPSLANGLVSLGGIGKQASDNLRNLGTGIKDLGIGLTNIGDGVARFTEQSSAMFLAIRDGLSGLSAISKESSDKLAKLGEGIKNLGSGIMDIGNGIEKFTENSVKLFPALADGLNQLSNVWTSTPEKLGKLGEAVNKFGSGLMDIVTAVQKLDDKSQTQFASMSEGLRELGRVSVEESARIEKLSNATKGVGTGFSDIGNGIKLFTKEVVDNLGNVEVAMVTLAAVGDNSVAGLNKLAGAMPKLANNFKTVAESVTAISTAVGSGIIDKLKELHKTLSGFDVEAVSRSFIALRDATKAALGDFDNNAGNGIASIDTFAAKLANASKELQRAVMAFKTPADMLVAAIDKMFDSFEKFGTIKFDQGLANIVTTLDTYVKSIDALATRIEQAVAPRTMPAPAAPPPEVTVAEINPMPTMQQVGGNDFEELVDGSAEQTEALNKIFELLSATLDKEALGAILGILQDNLPKMANNTDLKPALGGW